MLLVGKGAKGPKAAEAKAPAAEGPERTYAREAFSALKDDDEEGFIEAFLGAVRACSEKSESDEYTEEG